MTKTILIFTYFWIVLLFSSLGLLLWLILYLCGASEARKRFTRWTVQSWARHFLWMVGAKVSVEGLDRIPSTNRICFIANHQSALDVLCILGYAAHPPGFIAKKELMWAPFLNLWMLALHSVFINRRNPRKAIQAIEKGIENLRKGHPMVIFPEGTRSRDGKIHEFKPGSLKLSTRAKAIVVPVTIQGTWDAYEKTRTFTPGAIRVVFHPPLDTSTLTQEEQRRLPTVVQKIVESGFI